MKRFFIAIFVLIAASFSCTDDSQVFTPPEDMEVDIYEHLNHFRVTRNLGILDRHDVLDQYALQHSSNMAQEGQLNHDDMQERYVALIERLHITSYAELNAKGTFSGRDLIDQWAGDEDKENILKGNYSLIGIGVIEKNGELYITVIMVNY